MTENTKQENGKLPTEPVVGKEETAPETLKEQEVKKSPEAPKEPVKLTLVKNELISVLEYAETLAMIQVRESRHPGVAWAGGKLLDHLTEAKHWVYEIQLLPPMPKPSPIVQPKDFLRPKK